jgi:hypothetical protein
LDEMPGHVNNNSDDASPSPLPPSIAVDLAQRLEELPGTVNNGSDTLASKPPEIASAQDALKRRVHEAFMQQCDRGMTPTTAAIGALRRCTGMSQAKMSQTLRSVNSVEETTEMDVDALRRTCNRFSYECLSPTSWSVATC